MAFPEDLPVALPLSALLPLAVLGEACLRVGDNEQHLDNLRRKDSLTGAETPERAVRLGNYSASHFEGAANEGAPGGLRLYGGWHS